MKDTRSTFQIKSAALKRLIMWRYLAKILDLVLISEFPKSGGSWFGQMLSDVIDVPFPRNQSPKLKKSIMHGHHLYRSSFGKVIHVMRDGRDIMVSAYFHFLFENDRNPTFSVKHYRSLMPFNDYENISKNLPAFIEFMFTEFANRRFHFSWNQVIDSYIGNPKVLNVKYENLLTNPTKELMNASFFYGYDNVNPIDIKKTIDKYSFENQSRRKPGQENKKSFLRKGISGDWKNYFNEEACKVFKNHASGSLIKAGYESNNAWEV